MVDQPLHEKIEAYLLGQLPPGETADFKKEIESDSQLAEEVELHRLILPVSDRLAELDLHRDFARWRQEMETDPPESAPPAKPRNRLPGLIALALLIGAGAFLLWRIMEGCVESERAERRRIEQALLNAQQENEQLKQEKKQLQDDLSAALRPAAPVPKAAPPPSGGKQPIAAAPEPEYVQWADEGLMAYADDMLGSFRTRGGTDKPLIEKAATSLRLGQYREAAAFLRAVKPGDTSIYSRSLEMLAYTQFKRKQYTEAVNTYNKYREHNKDTEKTDWDLCLFYLADYPRYKNELRVLLDSILNDPKHPKYREASALMVKMEAAGLK